MKNSLRTIFVILSYCLVAWLPVAAQNTHIAPIRLQAVTFQHLPQDHDLAQEVFRSIAQDQQGMMWFGTGDGLVRYDGYQFTHYRNQPDDSTSLCTNYVSAIAVDSQRDVIWVGTNKGFACFDMRSERFTNYRHDPEDPRSIPDDDLIDIHVAHNGMIWLGGNVGGLMSFDPETQVFTTHYKHTEFELVANICEDPKGRIWFKSTNPLKLLQWDPQHSQVRDLSPEIGQGGSLHQDAAGTIWAFTERGVFRYDEKSDQLVSTAMKDIWKKNMGTDWEVNAFTFILVDRQGRFWFNQNEGFFRIDPSTENLEDLSYDPTNPNGLSFYNIWSLFEDQDGAVWVGLHKGLDRWDPYLQKFSVIGISPKISPSNIDVTINGIIEERPGMLWAGSWGQGLLNINIESGIVEAHFLQPPPGRQPENIVLSISKGPDEQIWLTSNLFHPQAHSFNQYTREFSLLAAFDGMPYPFDYWTVIPLDEEEAVIFGDSVLWFYDMEARTPWQIPITVPSSRGFQSVLKDSKGTYWLGSREGVLTYHPGSQVYQFFKPEPNNPQTISAANINGLYEDSRGHIWIIPDGNGVNEYIPSEREGESGRFVHWRATNSFLPHDNVTSVVEDQQGNIWIQTLKTVTKYDPQTQAYRHFDRQEIGLDFSNSSSSIIGQDGTLYVTGVGGISLVHPEKILINEIAPNIVLTEFSINNQPVPIAGSISDSLSWTSPLSQSIRFSEDLVLPYDQNDFSFSFAALSYTKPQKNQYAYRLQGFQNDWITTTAENRVATYTNIQPGEYTFQVKAANSDGVWNEHGVAIQIRVLPPWYRTEIAYALYVFLALSFFYGVYVFLRRHFERKNQLLLERKEAEKIRELDAAKTKLYTYMTHEFRTPITVILGMADQVVHHPDKWLNSGVDAIDRNARYLLRLINQMLNLAKLESGHLALNMIQGDIIQHVRYIMDSFHLFAESKNICLHFIANEPSFIMDYDPDKLMDILSNLLSNAIKFTPDHGDIHISVSVKKNADVQKESFLLQVKDSGVGIPEDELPHIFDRFYQAGIRTSGKTREGTGIGLALTKELVYLLDGEIAVESIPQRGSSFTISLPISRTAPKTTVNTIMDQQTAAAFSPTLVKEAIKIQPISTKEELPLVLIIEDNDDVRKYISTCLDQQYRLAFAPNGQIGIELGLELMPDLIISDVMMPEKDGFEVCEALKNDLRSSHIPIILLTARADTTSRLEGLRRGADAYLPKPFNKDELQIRIQTLLALRLTLQKYYLSALAEGAGLPESNVEEQDAPEHAFVQQVRGIMESHLADHQFGVNEMCREIGMSHSQLHRKLSALTGQSFNKLLRSIRLNKAQTLLMNQELTVAAVAYECGFNDHAYFHRVFKKEIGKTPTEFRKQ